MKLFLSFRSTLLNELSPTPPKNSGWIRCRRHDEARQMRRKSGRKEVLCNACRMSFPPPLLKSLLAHMSFSYFFFTFSLSCFTTACVCLCPSSYWWGRETSTDRNSKIMGLPIFRFPSRVPRVPSFLPPSHSIVHCILDSSSSRQGFSNPVTNQLLENPVVLHSLLLGITQPETTASQKKRAVTTETVGKPLFSFEMGARAK